MRFGLVLLIGAQLVSAQEPLHQSVIVTGTAVAMPLDEADRDVSVQALPHEERPLYDSWFSLLKLDPALNLQRRAMGGFLGDLSVRGATWGQTLVLLNGMRLNDAQTGHFNLDLPVPLEAVTSVEVLKGSGSALYGSDAIGGVVNVRTSVPESSELRLLGGGGNFGTNEEHALASFASKRFAEQLGFARDFSTGFQPNRDYRNLALSSESLIRTNLGASSLLLSLSDRPYGADQFYGSYPSWERIKTWFLTAHQDLGEKTEANFSYRRHTDLFVLFRYSPQIYTNRHILETFQGNLRRRENLPLHAVLSYGAEGLGESINSNNLGLRSRTRGSGYVFYDLRSVKRFSFSAGIREEVYGSGQVATSPSLSGAMWLSEKFKLRASASRAFRLPSYTDLYYSDPANNGNPNLKPESATSYEGGLDAYLRRGLRGSVTVFHRRDTNVIDYVRASVNDLWQATNFDKLHFTGVEASVFWEPRTAQRVGFSFTGLHGVNASGDVVLSKYTFNYPVQTAVAQWSGTVAKHLLARTSVGAAHRQLRPAYAVWDASASYTQWRVRPYVRLTNITSTVYQEITGVALPRRGVVGGIEIVLN
jgi:iron complex outermembrane receptor protein